MPNFVESVQRFIVREHIHSDEIIVSGYACVIAFLVGIQRCDCDVQVDGGMSGHLVRFRPDYLADLDRKSVV